VGRDRRDRPLPRHSEAPLITPDQVTAVIPTRGDVDLIPILATLPYRNVIVWDQSLDTPDCYGLYTRYAAIAGAPTRIVYTQDDDCIFEHHDVLMELYEPWRLTCVYGHGDNPDGLEDIALLHGGAIMDRALPIFALARYLERWPRDEAFMREADIIVGGLSPSTQLDLPYEIRYEIAARPNRMAHQPWQRDLKHKVAARTREIRGLVAA
jgi:hypothetical protein